METKTCTRCGEAKPADVENWHRNKRKADGWDSQCKACNTERMREKYAADPEWRDGKKKATRQYHLDNPEWSAERLRASHVAHREERYARHVERGKDPAVAASRRDASRRSESRRRAIIASVSEVDLISREDYERKLAECNDSCHICGCEVGADLHWDHLHPLAHGGSHTIDNLFPACSYCNVRKNACWPFTDKRREEIKQEVLALRASLSAGTEVP